MGRKKLYLGPRPPKRGAQIACRQWLVPPPLAMVQNALQKDLKHYWPIPTLQSHSKRETQSDRPDWLKRSTSKAYHYSWRISHDFLKVCKWNYQTPLTRWPKLWTAAFGQKNHDLQKQVFQDEPQDQTTTIPKLGGEKQTLLPTGRKKHFKKNTLLATRS